MASMLITLLFVLVMAIGVPLLVIVLIFRAIRRGLKSAGVPAGTLDLANLRSLIEQARLQKAQQGRAVFIAAPSLSATQPVPAPAIVISSMGRGASLIAYLFTGIGTVSAVVAIVFGAMQLQFLDNVVRAEGQVVRNVSRGGNKSGYHPVVRFEAEGETIEFEAPIGNRPAQFHVGEALGVLYPPGKPQQAKIDNWIQLWFAPMFGGFFTLVFGGLGVRFLIPTLRQRLNARWARENGSRVKAQFAGVRVDGTMKMNGRCPMKVLAQWRNPLDGKLYRYESPVSVWEDPSVYLSQHPDITLHVDPSQPRRYWMDTAFLQPFAARQ